MTDRAVGVRPLAPLACVVVFGVGACRAVSAPSAEDVLDALIAADNAGAVDDIASFYAEDAVLLPPSGPPVVGRGEIKRRYQAGFARFRLRVTLHQDGFRESNTVAFSHGSTTGDYVWLDGSPPTPFHDNYLMTLERDAAGDWKVAALMWSPFSKARE